MAEIQNRYMMRTGTLDQVAIDEGLRAHMLRVYNYMASGVLLSGIVAYVVANTALAQVIFGTPLMWVVMLAPIGFVFMMSWRFERMSAFALQACFWAFAALMGASLASVLLVFTGASIVRVFLITAAMFAGMSLYGYTTKADLSKFGSFLIMGLFGIVIAGLVNIFVQSSMMQFVISVVGVLVFTGLTAWDTQRIKEQYVESLGHEATSKLAVMGALSLYLNFVNLFTMLLNLLGQRNSE